MKKKNGLFLAVLCIGALGASTAVMAADPVVCQNPTKDASGNYVYPAVTSTANRYCLPRNYESEISAAEAYLKAVANRKEWGHEHGNGNEVEGRQPVIVDVRSIPEYVAGHPAGAFNVPYPFITQTCNLDSTTGLPLRHPDGACVSGGARIMQTDAALVAAVEQAVPDKNTPIYTLCRTGHRSVLAANVLTAAGYQHVRNIWQGFVGQTKVDYYGNAPLDLNHDGSITDADKDGWRNYQQLPYSKKLNPRLIYSQYDSTYQSDYYQTYYYEQ
jgi:rhodanese-related sulfurtransferase